MNMSGARSNNTCSIFFILFATIILLKMPDRAFAADSCTVWAKSTPYPANSCVTYNGKTYKTQWWAEAGVTPFIGANSWDSPWVLVGGSTPTPTPTPTPNACPDWVNNKGYPQDSCVTYNGISYKAQWWASAGLAPFIGKNSWDSPWVLNTSTPKKPGQAVISPIAQSAVKNITLKWSLTGTVQQGTSWSVNDLFNNQTTTVFPSTTTFGTSDTTSLQTGTALLTLDNGDHSLTVVLCNGASSCTSSAPVIAKINAAVSLPGIPTLQTVAPSTNGVININWSTTGNGGSYWTIEKDGNEIQSTSSFSDVNKKIGAANLTMDNGTYIFIVKLCNQDNVCQASNSQTVTVSGAPVKTAVFMAYYPTWFAPFHDAFCPGSTNCNPKPDAPVISNAEITKSSLLAGGIPNYVTHVIIAFGQLNKMRNYTGLSRVPGDLSKLGLNLTPSSASFKESIRVLKANNPGTKVILALGGATYNDSWNNVTQDDVSKLTQLIVDLGLDGLDVDYEVGGVDSANINKYYDSIVKMRQAVDAANAKSGKKAILSLAGWSTGADCTAQTQGSAYPECNAKISYWGGNAGRERLVLKGKGASTMIDAYGVMSYDAGYTHFDPIVAYRQYKALAKPGAIVAIGVEPSPDEGWGNATTFTVDKGIGSDNPCKGDAVGKTPNENTAGGNTPGNIILWDQYGNPKPGTFSIQRFANEVTQNSGDGMMMWSLFAYRPTPYYCGGALVGTVTDLGRAISQYLNIGSDRSKKIDKNAADTYNR